MSKGGDRFRVALLVTMVGALGVADVAQAEISAVLGRPSEARAL